MTGRASWKEDLNWLEMKTLNEMLSAEMQCEKRCLYLIGDLVKQDWRSSFPSSEIWEDEEDEEGEEGEDEV